MVSKRCLDQRLRPPLLRTVDAIDTHRSLLKASVSLGLSQRDEVHAALPERLEQLVADLAFVRVMLACQVPGHLVQHSAVGGVAQGDFQRHDLALQRRDIDGH